MHRAYSNITREIFKFLTITPKNKISNKLHFHGINGLLIEKSSIDHTFMSVGPWSNIFKCLTYNFRIHKDIYALFLSSFSKEFITLLHVDSNHQQKYWKVLNYFENQIYRFSCDGYYVFPALSIVPFKYL